MAALSEAGSADPNRAQETLVGPPAEAARTRGGSTVRIFAALTGFAAIAAALAASPAQAWPPEEPWARMGDWEIRPRMPGVCDARRDYPGGTSLFLSERDDGHGRLFVINRGWSLQIPGAYRLTLVQGGRRTLLLAPGGPEEDWHGLAVPVAADWMAALVAGGTVEVEAPDGALLERLDLAGLTPAAARLRACRAEAATTTNFPPAAPPAPPPPPPRRGKEQRARANSNLVSLFSSDDYPASAVRAREQGAVGFRLDVDKAGRVAGCTITSSSGSPALDSATCRLLAARARFTPARDRKGRPVPDSMAGRIVWRMPEPEPPPPPPPPT
jgi:TonB family protein